MHVFSSLIRSLGFTTILCMTLAGCAQTSGKSTPTSINLLDTPTPTPTVLALASDMEETEPPPGNYSIEIRMPYELDSSQVIADPGEGNVCIAEMPIQISMEEDRKMAHGSIDIECLYTIPSGPLPYTVNLINQYEASFDGEVLPPSESFPEGWIDGYLSVEGTITQYYTDFQMEVPNLCPESNPCSAPGNIVFNLPFHLVDGNRIEQEWIFILNIE